MDQSQDVCYFENDPKKIKKKVLNRTFKLIIQLSLYFNIYLLYLFIL